MIVYLLLNRRSYLWFGVYGVNIFNFFFSQKKFSLFCSGSLFSYPFIIPLTFMHLGTRMFGFALFLAFISGAAAGGCFHHS